MARPIAKRRTNLVFQDNALLDPAKQAMLLDRVKQMGGTGIQQDVSWGQVYKNGKYDFSTLDALVNAANARGIRPQFRLWGTTSTMQQSNPGIDAALNTAHPNANLLRQFAYETAKNFGGRVSKYTIWNEPNIGSGRSTWGNPKQAARTYRSLFQAGSAGVRAANPNAKIGFGETVGGADERGAMSELGFLRSVLAAGSKPLTADYVSVHPYQLGNPNQTAAQIRANPDYAGIGSLQNANNLISRAFAHGRLRSSTGKRPALALGEFGYKHNWVPNSATRAAYLRRAVELANQAGASSINLYQLLPNTHASNWDSSILGPQGQIPQAFRHLNTAR